MKDIDFDELDRAVSSVLSKDKPVITETASENVVVESVSKKDDAKSPAQSDAPAEINAIITNPRPKTAAARPSGPSLATARRGKFMDMMHQPVQTKPSSLKPAAEPVVKKEIVTLEPSKELQNETKAAQTEAAAETSEPVVTVSPVEHTSEPTASLDDSNTPIGAEPTLIDQSSVPSSDEAPTQAADVPTSEKKDVKAGTENESKDEDSADATEDQLDALSLEESPAASSSLSTSVPQESPFLADTKVEKRPLGGSQDSEENQNDLAGYGLDTYEKKDVQSAPVVPVPRELEDDIVKVEAAQNEQDQALAGSPFAANVAASAEPNDDGRVDGHPLFDTSTYHEPIAAVHHDGMPGWAKWLIGLMVCLALGAGVGYFLFTAGL